MFRADENQNKTKDCYVMKSPELSFSRDEGMNEKNSRGKREQGFIPEDFELDEEQQLYSQKHQDYQNLLERIQTPRDSSRRGRRGLGAELLSLTSRNSSRKSYLESEPKQTEEELILSNRYDHHDYQHHHAHDEEEKLHDRERLE